MPLRKLDDLKGKKHYISLGACCMVSFTLTKYHTAPYTLFDWNYTPDNESIIKFLEDGMPIEDGGETALIGFTNLQKSSLKNYNFWMPHTNFDQLHRRRLRLLEILNNPQNNIVFIRMIHRELEESINSGRCYLIPDKCTSVSLDPINRLINAIDKNTNANYALIIDSDNIIKDELHPLVKYIQSETHDCQRASEYYKDLID